VSSLRCTRGVCCCRCCSRARRAAVGTAFATINQSDIRGSEPRNRDPSERSLYPAAERGKHPHPHGRPGPLARQRLRRSGLEIDRVRGGLPARLPLGQRGSGLAGTLDRVLQHPPPPLQPESANARSGILPPPAGNHGSLTQKTEPPLNKRQNLFKEAGPAQCDSGRSPFAVSFAFLGVHWHGCPSEALSLNGRLRSAD